MVRGVMPMCALPGKGASEILAFAALLCAVSSCAAPAIPERTGETHVRISHERAFELARPVLEEAGFDWKSLRILSVSADYFYQDTAFRLVSTKGERAGCISVLVAWDGKVYGLGDVEPYEEPFDESQGAPLSEGYGLPAPEMSEEEAWNIVIATLKPVKPQGLEIETYELLSLTRDYADGCFEFYMEPPDAGLGSQILVTVYWDDAEVVLGKHYGEEVYAPVLP